MDKKLLVYLVALILSAFCLVSFAEEPSETTSDVLVLSKANFSETVDPEILFLVEFYAPWCGHCQALAPEYEKAATILKAENIKLAKVDCTAETELCQEYEVRGYPTLKVLKGGSVMEYNGGRKVDLIVSYMKKQALPAVSNVTVDTLDTFKTSDNIVIIGFWNIENQKEHDIFVEIAEQLRNDFLFGQTGQKEAAEKAGVTAPAVVLYSNVEEGYTEVFKDTFEKENIIKFIKVYSIPVLGEVGPDNYSYYVESGLPITFLFYANEEQRTLLTNCVNPLLEKFKGQLTFAYIDANKYGAHAENINLKEQWPAIGIQKLDKPDSDFQKFPFDQSKEITPEAVSEFITSFAEGKLTPDVKSAPIPENNDGPVYILVANNFEDVVYNKSKDVLVEFYAPWCGHCKKLSPIYDELGTLYGEHKDKIVIAKMDATENDLPPRVPFKIGGFPTIKLFKGDDKEIVDYSGDRTLDSFVEFLKNNAYNKVDVEVKTPSDTETPESPSSSPSSPSPPSPVESETPESHDEL